MRSGALVVLLVPLLALGLGSAAIVPDPLPESLVEGHTVFATLEVVDDEALVKEYAAAVAVLVRERVVEDTKYRFPGVLWFNDQYLVDPVLVDQRDEFDRYPCSGAVLAVNAGDPIPFRGPIASNDGATYHESYHVVDPNDHTWIVDRWWILVGAANVSIWTVALLGDELRANEADDGDCTGPVYEDGCRVFAGPLGCVHGADLGMIHVQGAPTTSARDPGTHGWGYPCGDDAAPCRPLLYNAVLYFLLDDLTDDAGVKDHRDVPGTDRENDVSGCHEPAGEWPCPASDDDREGNSHPYNPEPILGPYAGAGNHGGSDASSTPDLHAVRSIDLYYGVAVMPTVREWRVFDVPGSSAPYHCHDPAGCGPGI